MPVVVLLMILYYIIFGSVAISSILVAVAGFTLTFGPNADGVDDASTIYFADNRVWGTYVVSGFILYRMSGSTRIGNALDPWLFRTGISNPNRLASPSKLTRAN